MELICTNALDNNICLLTDSRSIMNKTHSTRTPHIIYCRINMYQC